MQDQGRNRDRLLAGFKIGGRVGSKCIGTVIVLEEQCWENLLLIIFINDHRLKTTTISKLGNAQNWVVW